MLYLLTRRVRVGILVWLALLMLSSVRSAFAADAEAVSAPTAPQLSLSEPPRILNYQGYLSSGNGAAYSGTLPMTAALYDGPNSDTLRWGPESFSDVPVQNGLFHLALGRSVELAAEVFEQELWVEIRIDGVAMPRQPLRPAPYAFGLIAGARVVGSPAASDYGLAVVNQAEVEEGTGIYAMGEEIGIYANTRSSSGLGFFTPKAVEASRGYRGPDSILHISPVKGRAWDHTSGSLLTTNVGNNGTLLLRSTEGSCPCLRIFYVPIDVPSVLYGQDVTLKEVAMQYRTLRAANSSTAITRVSLLKLVSLEETVTMVDHQEPLNSMTPATPAFLPGNPRLDADSGAVVLRLEITFANNTDFVNLGQIRAQIGHTP